jgi:hypothetical protein
MDAKLVRQAAKAAEGAYEAVLGATGDEAEAQRIWQETYDNVIADGAEQAADDDAGWLPPATLARLLAQQAALEAVQP